LTNAIEIPEESINSNQSKWYQDTNFRFYAAKMHLQLLQLVWYKSRNRKRKDRDLLLEREKTQFIWRFGCT